LLGAAVPGGPALLRLDKALHANLEPPAKLLPACTACAAHRGAAQAAGAAIPTRPAIPDSARAAHRDIAAASARTTKAPRAQAAMNLRCIFDCNETHCHASLHINFTLYLAKVSKKQGRGGLMLYQAKGLGSPSIHMAEIGAVVRLAFSDVATEFGLTPSNCANHPSFLSDAAILEPLSKPDVVCFGAFAQDDTLVGFAAIWPKGERPLFSPQKSMAHTGW